MAPKNFIVKTFSQSSAIAGARDVVHLYGTRRTSAGLGAAKELAATIKSLLSENESNSGNSTVASSPRRSFASSPRQSSPSRTDLGVMAVNSTRSMSLEDQIAILSRTVETLTMGIKERDEQLDFVMKRLNIFSGKENTAEKQNQQCPREDE